MIDVAAMNASGNFTFDSLRIRMVSDIKALSIPWMKEPAIN